MDRRAFLGSTAAVALVSRFGWAASEHRIEKVGLQLYTVRDLLSKDFEDRGRYKNVKNPIATTWLISFRQILNCDSLAADYLRIMSCLVEEDIPYSLLPPATKARKTEAIGTLTAYAFITQRKGQNSYDIHRLVQLAVRNWLKEQGEFVNNERLVT